MAFDQNTRSRLQRLVADARSLLADEFTRQLQAAYGMNPKTGEVSDIRSLSGLTPSQQETAHLLRDTLAHYLANAEKGKEKARKTAAIERIVREQAFTVLNRLAALRMSEARGFLIESLAKGYDSKGFQWFHRISGTSLGETGDAYRHYLFSLFDEFSLDLSVLFDRFSVQGRLFPSTPVLLKLLVLINDEGIAPLWAEDETIGWIYQYFNTQEERKKMREQSQAPRNSRELAVRNQFFTPRYVVEFLTDNTLGRIWYEMTQGETELKQCCKYLVRRPNELFLAQGEIAPVQEENLDLSQEELLQQTVYIEHRAIKDPRDIRMLDPACGSMHFGLYAFDLFEVIYNEAWDIETAQGTEDFSRENGRSPITSEYKDKTEFLIDIPRLIIENNIHGVDIDPRATQIAGLSLWLRAHNSWQQAGIKPQFRPKIQRSNIVCAEPMPGEKALLQEFTTSLKPTVLGQLVEIIFEKMELAGEAGTLLKIEQEIQDAIVEAKQVWQHQNKALSQFPDLAKIAKQRGEIAFDVSDIDDEGFWEQAEQKILDALAEYAEGAAADGGGQKRLFTEDATKGFAFIDLSRKRFDVVLMNPPFCECSPKIEKYLDSHYGKPSSKAVYAPFILRASDFSVDRGLTGALSARGAYFLSTYDNWRQELIANNTISIFSDLGYGIFEGPIVETICIVLRKKPYDFLDPSAIFMRLLDVKERDRLLHSCAKFDKQTSNRIFIRSVSDFLNIPTSPFAYWYPYQFYQIFKKWRPLKSDYFTACQGMSTTDDFRYMRLGEEVFENSMWPLIAKGGDYATYYSKLDMRVNWEDDGRDLKGNKKAVLRNHTYYFKPGITWTEGTTSCFSARFFPTGAAISGSGQGIYCLIENSEDIIFGLLGYLNSRLAHTIIEAMVSSGDFSQAGGVVRHYSTDLIGRIPIPSINSLVEIVEPAKKLHKIQSEISSLLNYCDEELILDLISSGKCSISQYCNENWLKIAGLVSECIKLINKIDRTVEEVSGFSETWLDYLSGPLLAEEKCCDDVSEIETLLSLSDSELVEKAFSIYPLRRIKKLGYFINRRLELISLIAGTSVESFIPVLTGDKYNPISETDVAYVMLDRLLSDSFIKDGIRGIYQSCEKVCDVSDKVRVEFNRGLACSVNLENEVLNKIKESSLDKVFSNPKNFFEYHYSKNSRNRRYSPLIWPLQLPSRIYTIWIYYHHLNEQTLFTCVNNFIDPKLESVVNDIAALRNKTCRSNDDEKGLTKLSDLEIELNDFRDKLLRIARFWRPNLNDGVQITAAPLWRLFQHKAWQKKLKETWEQLEEGEYDWAHLAYSIWPARVLRKCHQDRSLAIAHGVEEELWHEVEVIKGHKKEPVWEWQPKPLSDTELNAYIQNKTQAQGTVA